MNTIDLDPAEDYLDARNLNALIERWLSTLKVAPVTAITYRDKISHFVRWWDKEGPRLQWQLTQAGLHAFELHLRTLPAARFGTPLSYQSRHAIIRTLRMMFKWAARTNRTARNFGEWVPWPVGDTPQRKSPTVAHLSTLMLATKESRQPVRDQAILAFFIGTGCRLGEVAGLRVEDLHLLADGSGTAQIIGKRTTANPSGQRAVAFDTLTGNYLSKYVAEVVIATGPLWINDYGDYLSAPGLYQMVKRTVKRAGLCEHIRGCHDLRRAFATIMGLMHPDSPGWADLIRRQLGHKHYTMTAHYTLIDVDDIRQRLMQQNRSLFAQVTADSSEEAR